MDHEQPASYYELKDFEILALGKNISDMKMDPTRPYLYLADYGNNAVLRIEVSGAMKLDRKLAVGSHPLALDITPDQQRLVVALNGESNLKVIDLESFALIDTLALSFSGVNDVACATPELLLASSEIAQKVASLVLPGQREQFEAISPGELLASGEGKNIFVASSGAIRKYDLSAGSAALMASSTPFEFFAQINHFVLSPDREEVYVCLADPKDRGRVRDVLAYSAKDLTLAGKYEIKSAGLGVAISKDSRRIFVAPTDADGAGVFVVEFDRETKAAKKYYLAAGNLKAHGIVIDPHDRYLYVAVDTPGDEDSFEPYKSFSFDLQRLAIE
jgi:DNA-binding beta-propeller fold protein YncE